MSEYTLEMEDLRQLAGYFVDVGDSAFARRIDKALQAWEADLKRIEALERENGILKGNMPNRILRHLMAIGLIAKAPTIAQIERERAALAQEKSE